MSNDRDDDNDPLEVIWDDIRVARRRAETPRPAERLLPTGSPNDLVIGTSRERILVTIKPDGRVEFGPEYRPDEAAMVFWEAMGRQRFAYEERILIIQHMEAILTRLGAADLQLENLRRASAEGDTEATQQAAHAHVRLERLVHQAIELGRGLARRPEIPMPVLPDRVPVQIQANPQSEYQGRGGLEPDPVCQNCGSPLLPGHTCRH